MHYAKRAVVAMIFAVSAVCVGQQGTSAIPTQSESAEAPVRDPHSTPADFAVPLCPAKFDGSLETNGIAGHVTPPKIIHSAEAGLTNEVREATGKANKIGFVGDSLASLVVDEHGNPQNLCLRKTSGYGLDANAANAVRRYTFKPATKDGKPVPGRIVIEINHNYYSPNP
jgi:hypothetical protein